MPPPKGETSSRRFGLLARLVGALIVPLLMPASLFAADSVTAVTPQAEGVLHKCRGWIVATSCRTYHHIELPPRVAVGDTITVTFGSHPKEFGFYVAKIVIENGHCTLLSEAEGDPHRMDRITVTPCRPAPPP
jgi:hypothetical protein